MFHSMESVDVYNLELLSSQGFEVWWNQRVCIQKILEITFILWKVMACCIYWFPTIFWTMFPEPWVLDSLCSWFLSLSYVYNFAHSCLILKTLSLELPLPWLCFMLDIDSNAQLCWAFWLCDTIYSFDAQELCNCISKHTHVHINTYTYMHILIRAQCMAQWVIVYAVKSYYLSCHQTTPLLKPYSVLLVFHQ